MKRIFALFFSVLFLLSFVSCAKQEDVPQGYQLASDPDTCQYYLYVPEDTWVVSKNNNGTFTQATVLNQDKSNISMTVVDYTSAETIDEYWVKQKEENAKFLSELTVEVQGDGNEYAKVEVDGTFGYRYIFTGLYGDALYKFEQIIIPHDDGLLAGPKIYVFTYTAPADSYDTHIEAVEGILKHFKFK